MTKRWIIRIFFIALLTLCVVAWVGSYFRSVGIAFNGSHRFSSVDVDCGEVHLYDFAGLKTVVLTSLPFYSGPASPDAVRNWLRTMTYHHLGFGVSPYHDVHVVGRKINWGDAMFPLWFPSLLCTLLLWFVWRKTKPKPIGRAFPVEPTAKPKVN